MGMLRVRFVPQPPAGLTWTSAALTASWDMAWSDGVQRPPPPAYGVINALGTEFITLGGSQTDWFRVPGTDVGTNQIIGPMVNFEFSGVDSAGQLHKSVWRQQVDATAANEWDIRRQAASALVGTNTAGVNPPGLSTPDIGVTVAPFPYGNATSGTAGIVRLATNADSNSNTPANPTHVLTAANQHGNRHGPGGADPLNLFGSATFAAPSGFTFLEFGRGATDTPFLDFHSSGTGLDYDVRFYFYGGNGTTLGGGSLDISAAVFRLNGSQIVNEANMTARNNLTNLPASSPTLAWIGGVGSQANIVVLDTTAVVVDAKEVLYKITANFAVAGTVQINGAFASGGWTLIDADIRANRLSGAVPHPQVSNVRNGALITFADTQGQLEALIRVRRNS